MQPIKKHFYQEEDRSFVDYQLYELDELLLRGPACSSDDYIAYLGAAQTFGRFCPDPFPAIIGRELGIGSLNLGQGGAGPSYFLSSPHAEVLLEKANQAKLVVIQVMSGRSVGNSVFESPSGMSAGFRLPDHTSMRSEAIWSDLLLGKDRRGLDYAFVEELFLENSKNYVNAMIELLGKITPPKVLFWFSVRSPDQFRLLSKVELRQVRLSRRLEGHPLAIKIMYKLKIFKVPRQPQPILGAFPQLVTGEMVRKISSHCDAYVECITNEGLPQKLMNSTNESARINRYYPSPEMHRKAASQLLGICHELLNGTPS